MTKMIVLPDRVLVENVHSTVKFVKPLFIIHQVDPNVARLLHLRLMPWRSPKDAQPMYPSSILVKYTEKWQDRYNQMIANLSLPIHRELSNIFNKSVWRNVGLQIMIEMSRCYAHLCKISEKVCPSRIRCMANLTSIEVSDWIYGSNNWISL
uniref:DDE-1 domain-containing protein n=1 Tax=Syphacia muris TaxID=451379 RepID=A0A0N5AYA2_9BILA